MFHPSRRLVLGSMGSLAIGLPPARAQGRAGPIRIGCISALTGSQEVRGRPILNGAQIAADQINAAGGVLGRPIEIVAADAHADPATAVQHTRQFARDSVNLLCGCVTSELALAVSPELQPAGAVMITCSAQTDKLTHEAFVPNFFRVTDQTYMRNRAQARLMVQRYPEVASWGAILPDNEYGRASWAAFRDGLLEAYAGKQSPVISGPVLAKFGETDFRFHIDTLKRRGMEGLFIAVNGEDAIAFYRQAQQAKLFAAVQVLADSVNEFIVPQQLGFATPEHLWLAMSWYYGGYMKEPMGRALYDDNMRRTGNGLPLGFVNGGHSAVHAYAAAIAKAKSTETPAVIKALEGLTFKTAKGEVTFRPEDHQAICDVNFIRIKSSPQSLTMDIADGERSDIEVAEFVRFDGAEVIEPATPTKKLEYRFPA